MQMHIKLALAGAALVGVLVSRASLLADGSPAPAAATAGCLAPASWYSLDEGEPRRVNAHNLLSRVAQHDVVLLGEQHDDTGHHQWQLQTLAALHLLRPDMVIGFESFPRRAQPVLDRWIAGELTAGQFLEQSEWSKVWSFPPELYMPLFDFARLNRIRIAALNVDRALTEAVRKKGWDAVAAEQKEEISRPAPASQDYRNFLYEVYRQHEARSHGAGRAGKNDLAFQFFVESQTTWDRAMAEVLARHVVPGDSGAPPLVVGIAGSGHIRGGHGVPAQLRDLGVRNVAVLLPVNARRDCADLQPGLADAVFAVPDVPGERAPPPRLGIQLQETGGEVRIAEVLPGSLAEKSGLERGDHIVSIAGAPITKMAAVVAAVRAQPAGTWLPIEVRRNREPLELIVKFPRQ